MSQPLNYGIVRSYGHVWDEATQTWIPETQPGASVGATTVLVPDGSDATQGSIADAGVATDAPGTISAKLRGLVSLARSLVTLLTSVWDGGTHLRIDGSSVVQPISATNLDVALSTRLKPADTLTKVTTVDTITNPVAVTGTFYPVTQPVSGPVTDTELRASAVPVSLATLPNPSNLDAAVSTLLKPADTLTKVTTVDTITNPVAVTGTFYPATQPVSGPLTNTELRAAEVPISVASLPLPTSAVLEAGGNLETLVNISGALLIEIRLLRQAFEDWSGTRPRYDPRFDPDKYEVQ